MPRRIGVMDECADPPARPAAAVAGVSWPKGARIRSTRRPRRAWSGRGSRTSRPAPVRHGRHVGMERDQHVRGAGRPGEAEHPCRRLHLERPGVALHLPGAEIPFPVRQLTPERRVSCPPPIKRAGGPQSQSGRAGESVPPHIDPSLDARSAHLARRPFPQGARAGSVPFPSIRSWIRGRLVRMTSGGAALRGCGRPARRVQITY